MKPVKLTSAARADIEQAGAWYESKREGLGIEFTDRVLEAIDRIDANPESYAAVFKDVRRVQLKQFTHYALWFQLRQDNSLVIACLSGRRDPRLAKERALGIITMARKPPAT